MKLPTGFKFRQTDYNVPMRKGKKKYIKNLKRYNNEEEML